MRHSAVLLAFLCALPISGTCEEPPPLVLKSQGGNVVAIALQPNGKLLFTLDDSHAIFVWDTESGKQVKGMEKLSRMKGDVCIAPSPDGRSIAAGGQDGKLMLYTVENCEKRKLGETTDSILCVAFAPDGQTIITGTADHKVQAWDFDKGEPRLLGTLTKDVISLAVSSDGKLVASGSRDGCTCTWDLAGGKQIGKSKPVGSLVTAVLFDSQGRVASGTADGRLRAWSADKLKEERDTVGHKGEIVGLVKLKKPGFYATAGKDGKVQIWNDERITLVESFDAGGTAVGIASRPSDDGLAWSTGKVTYFKILGAKK